MIAIVHFGSVGRLCGLFERSKATQARTGLHLSGPHSQTTLGRPTRTVRPRPSAQLQPSAEAEAGHDFLAQFRVRASHTNNQVNPGQRASKRFKLFWSHLKGLYGSVLYFPGLSRYFDCFDSILEWDRISGMEVVFDSLIFLAVLMV